MNIIILVQKWFRIAAAWVRGVIIERIVSLVIGIVVSLVHTVFDVITKLQCLFFLPIAPM